MKTRWASIRAFRFSAILSASVLTFLFAGIAAAQSAAPSSTATRSDTANSSSGPAVFLQDSNRQPNANAGTSANTTGIPTVAAPNNYQLKANDQVAIEVFGEDDLRTAARLNSDGSVSVPLLGSIRLGGLTLGQATARLTELYGRDYLVNPRVSVSLVAYAKQRFTVLGQVGRPGSYEMPEGSPEGIDLLEAIAMAGGYTRIAAPERISVRRGDKVFRVDAKRLAKREGESFRVQPGDTITVAESIF